MFFIIKTKFCKQFHVNIILKRSNDQLIKFLYHRLTKIYKVLINFFSISTDQEIFSLTFLHFSIINHSHINKK